MPVRNINYLWGGEQFAERVAEDPIFHEWVNGREGDREHAHEHVRKGQVDDEDVGGVAPHVLVPNHHDHDQHIAHDADNEDEQVQEAKHDPDPSLVDEKLAARWWIIFAFVDFWVEIGHVHHLQGQGRLL